MDDTVRLDILEALGIDLPGEEIRVSDVRVGMGVALALDTSIIRGYVTGVEATSESHNLILETLSGRKTAEITGTSRYRIAKLKERVPNVGIIRHFWLKRSIRSVIGIDPRTVGETIDRDDPQRYVGRPAVVEYFSYIVHIGKIQSVIVYESEVQITGDSGEHTARNMSLSGIRVLMD